MILLIHVLAGRFFDPMGLSRGDAAKYQEYKQKEVKNGRLAMVRKRRQRGPGQTCDVGRGCRSRKEGL